MSDYRCPTPCDNDCKAPCHELHQPRHKQQHDALDCAVRVAPDRVRLNPDPSRLPTDDDLREAIGRAKKAAETRAGES